MSPASKPLRIVGVLLLLALGAAALWFLLPHSHKTAEGKADQLWTCGMHPEIIRSKPGLCPICGMKLTPIRKQPQIEASGTNTAADDDSVIKIDPATVQNMGLRLGKVTRGEVRRSVRTLGVVDFDETALSDVTTKFKGWIEKLYVDATGKQVHKGEPLFEIYSPDLYTAQTEYVLALSQGTNTPGAESLRATALGKLRFFDISEEQIAELEKTRMAKRTLRVSSPRDGIVVEKMAVEGQMADAGMKLYRLADLSTVWVQSQVYEQDLADVRLGQEATVSLSYLPDRIFRGRVTYVYPTVDDKTRTAKLRTEFHNPGFFLKPGMFAKVELKTESDPNALLIPDSAVLRSGEVNTVFVALPGGRFEARTITLGPRTAGYQYQLLSGVSEGEQVVVSGQFMLDSESQLREAIAKMKSPPTSGATPEGAQALTNRTAVAATRASTTVAYICPMPEHVAIQYERPGKCPICRMTLVPVTLDVLALLQPGGQVKFYTCPMPEHRDVHLEKAGKCPKCGMTLIPVMEVPTAGPTTNAPTTQASQPQAH